MMYNLIWPFFAKPDFNMGDNDKVKVAVRVRPFNSRGKKIKTIEQVRLCIFPTVLNPMAMYIF